MSDSLDRLSHSALITNSLTFTYGTQLAFRSVSLTNCHTIGRTSCSHRLILIDSSLPVTRSRNSELLPLAAASDIPHSDVVLA